MSVQTNYNYSTPIASPGAIADLAPYAIDAFANEENTGVLKFGMGVVNGTVAGKTCKKPASGATAGSFLGITVNGRTTESGLEGETYIRNKATVGVMRYGRIYGRVVSGVTISYGNPVYLAITGDNAGLFTNAAGDTGTTVAVKGRFLGPVDASTGVAQIELFNQAQQ